MEHKPNSGRKVEGLKARVSALDEAYALLGAETPMELSNLYAGEDQRLMEAGAWDYDNPELITNKVKVILESIDASQLSEEENVWRNEILWFWYHHAISSAIWRQKDPAAAQKFSEKALELQGEEHPNKITKLLYYLTRDRLDEAEEWAGTIADDMEQDTASQIIGWYKKGQFYQDQVGE